MGDARRLDRARVRLRAARREAGRRHERRHRELPARRRRVDEGPARCSSERFPGGETANGLVVYQRDGGLTAADQAQIAADAERVERRAPARRARRSSRSRPARAAELVSRDGSVAYTVVTVPLDFDEFGDWGKDAREITGDGGPDGLDVYLTGDLGLNADFEEVFADFDIKLLLATALLVLVLLGADLPRAAHRDHPDRSSSASPPARQRRSSTSTPTPARR